MAGLDDGSQEMSKFPERVTEQRQAVVEKIVADMTAKGYEWIEPFEYGHAPQNPISGTTYKGGNRLHLSVISAMRGYDDPRWMTFNQAKKAGFHMKKGAKSAIVEKWKSYTITGNDEETGEETRRSFLHCIGYWSVFNFSEFENTPEWEEPDYTTTSDELSEIADMFMQSSRCEITECESPEAFYSPASDEITVPLRGQFKDNESFLRVLWHEMAHSTMHSGTPATRDSHGAFGTADYAYEELIAELGSVFVGNGCGLVTSTDTNTEHYKQHIAYLQSWIAALQHDPAYMFKAAAIAEKAADYLMENYNSLTNSKAA